VGRLARNLGRSVAVLAAFVAALVVVELVLRSVDPFGVSYYRDTNRYLNEAIQLLPPDVVGPESRIFQNCPRVDLALETFRFATDSVGLRAASHEAVTEPRSGDGRAPRLRILFLGDSVTLGWGVDDDETWVRRLERGARAADGRELECLNAGHLQYNSVQEADLLATVAPLLHPDAVVVTFVTNDLTDDPFPTYEALMAAVRTAEAERGSGATLRNWRTRITGWFWALRGVLEFKRNAAAEAEAIEGASAGGAPADVTAHEGYEAGWERVRTGLERMLAHCRAADVPLVVLDHGTPRVPAVRAWCEAAGVPWFDFTFTDAELAEGLRNSPADAHANARGNELLFEKARRALASAGLLAPRGSGGGEDG
jgi:lysophospholipase L1-like esterase